MQSVQLEQLRTSKDAEALVGVAHLLQMRFNVQQVFS